MLGLKFKRIRTVSVRTSSTPTRPKKFRKRLLSELAKGADKVPRHSESLTSAKLLTDKCRKSTTKSGMNPAPGST